MQELTLRTQLLAVVGADYPPDPNGQWTIRQSEYQILGGIAGHNSLALINPQGQTVRELQGLATNWDGSSMTIGFSLYDRISIHEFGFQTGLWNNTYSTVLWSGDEARATQLWTAGLMCGNEINAQNIHYPFAGLGSSFGTNATNSNAAFTTLLACMALPMGDIPSDPLIGAPGLGTLLLSPATITALQDMAFSTAPLQLSEMPYVNSPGVYDPFLPYGRPADQINGVNFNPGFQYNPYTGAAEALPTLPGHGSGGGGPAYAGVHYSDVDGHVLSSFGGSGYYYHDGFTTYHNPLGSGHDWTVSSSVTFINAGDGIDTLLMQSLWEQNCQGLGDQDPAYFATQQYYDQQNVVFEQYLADIFFKVTTGADLNADEQDYLVRYLSTTTMYTPEAPVAAPPPPPPAPIDEPLPEYYPTYDPGYYDGGCGYNGWCP